MRTPIYLRPSLAFGLVYLLAMAVSQAAKFDAISLQTHALILSLLLIGMVADFFVGLMPARERADTDEAWRYSALLVWSLVGLVFVGFLFVLQTRLAQLANYDSVQSLRMALIVGDVPSLPFPLSNVQSVSHALGISLLVLSVHRFKAAIPRGLKLAIAAAFLMSITVAMLEGNRASFIIIAVQVFLILGLSGRAPSYSRLLAFAAVLFVLFALLQFFVRQNADGDDASLVMDLVLRNVASYVSGGVVAFDKAFSGSAAVPPYILPVGGGLASLLGADVAGDDVILPFLDLGNDTAGNVYSALFYIGFLHNMFFGYVAFTLLVLAAAYFFRFSHRGKFSLLIASYLGVTFLLWPLSEYWLSLLPLFMREVLLLGILGTWAFRRTRSADPIGSVRGSGPAPGAL